MKKTLKITIACGMILAFGACSSSPSTNGENGADPTAAPATDAATDAVPQPGAENGATPQASASGDAASVPPSPAGNGTFDSYTVQAGDTLMKIAFETYGDLYRWKGLLEANKDKVTDPNRIPAGTVLKVEKTVTPVTVEKNGDKYMIKNGDTLGTISNDVYGTKKKWKTLWENNKQLIHDPNRIFAGFYLYYQPADGAKPADPGPSVTPAPMANQGAAADTTRTPASNDAPPASNPPAPAADAAAAPAADAPPASQ